MTPIDQEAFSLYLQPTGLCDFDAAPEIGRTALKLAQDNRDSLIRARCLHTYVKNLTYRFDDWHIKSSETLERGWGMCSGKTNLLVAMLRFLNIPARYLILKCRSEKELFRWMISRNNELAHLLGEPYSIVDHVVAEAYIGGAWQMFDPARDPGLEKGFIFLKIPLEMHVLESHPLASFDDWAFSRQNAIRIKNDRANMLKLMNDQLEELRKISA